ncbi:head GIN domain-containing protein [Croceiramulus getboli]|nr:DUF2807 domain-containing protein [Flavobacteriaceae bacterium YJPT1-3]
MRIWICLVCCLLLFACDSEEANDCLQTSGALVQQEFAVPVFTKIRTEQDMRLLLKEGPEQQVIIETGANLLNDVEVEVVDGVLALRNKNRCNLFREYEITRAIVTAPNITELRNGSGLEIQSDGVLNYPSLTLVSNTSIDVEGIRKSGVFDLQVNTERLIIRTNGLSVFYIQGQTELLDIRFDDEQPRLEGANLIAQEVQFFHRGANDMIVHPVQALRGTLVSTGNVIAVNRPPIVEVDAQFTGSLIFQD